MHPNPIFRETDSDRNLDLLRETRFGTLVINGDPLPLMAHVPFFYADGALWLHLVRSNPITQALKTGSKLAKIAVQGPHGYISPDWYGMDDQVPTWNYVAVHAIGELHLLPDAELEPILNKLSDHFESQLAPKPIWKMDKVSADAKTRMMRQIVPCRFDITELDGTWKLGQNKPDAARIGAADELAHSPIGTDQEKLAEMMKSVA